MIMPRKDAGFRIRIESDLHERFLMVCRAQDRPAAQVLREFMRDYIEENRVTVQDSLFDIEEIRYETGQISDNNTGR